MKHIVSSTGMVHRLKDVFPSFRFGRFYFTRCNRTLVIGKLHKRRPPNAPRCWYCYKGK